MTTDFIRLPLFDGGHNVNECIQDVFENHKVIRWQIFQHDTFAPNIYIEIEEKATEYEDKPVRVGGGFRVN